MIGVGIMNILFSSGRAPITLTNTFTLPGGVTEYVVGDKINFTRPSDTIDVSYNNQGLYEFPVRNGRIFLIRLFGAGGGKINNIGYRGGNANGGWATGYIDLSNYRNTNLFIVRGGGGQGSSANIDGSPEIVYYGGYNGGGHGGGTRGPGGGGRTDLRTSTPGTSNGSMNYTTELMVAGGGGGGYGTLSYTGTRFYGKAGGIGYVGSYAKDNAGGGGGYYGGDASDSDDGSNGGSGTNWFGNLVTQVLVDARFTDFTSGGNAGHGYFEIEVMSI
jgi:hypothetical protein